MQASDRQPNRLVTDVRHAERARGHAGRAGYPGQVIWRRDRGSAIVDLVQRYEIGASTPLREGLSRLMSRGLIVGMRATRLSRRRYQPRGSARHPPACVAPSRSRPSGSPSSMATTPGRPGSSARCTRCAATSSVPAMNSARARRISTGCTRAFITAVAGRLRLKTPARGPFRSLRPGLSLPRVMMRSFDSGKKFVRAHQLLADRVIARDISDSPGHAGGASALHPQFVYPPGSES